MNDIISAGLEKELGYIIISVFIMLIISVPSPKKIRNTIYKKKCYSACLFGESGYYWFTVRV